MSKIPSKALLEGNSQALLLLLIFHLRFAYLFEAYDMNVAFFRKPLTEVNTEAQCSFTYSYKHHAGSNTDTATDPTAKD